MASTWVGRGRQHAAVLLAAGLCAAAVAACGGGSATTAPGTGAGPGGGGITDELVNRAQEEGSLLIYLGMPEATAQEWISAFEEEYAISVELYRAGTNSLFQRWTQEISAGRFEADVVNFNAEQFYEEAIANEWIAPYAPAEADAYAFPAENSALGGYVYPLYVSTEAVVWNTDQTTPEEQERFREDPLGTLADPAFEGRISLSMPAGGTTLANWSNVVLHNEDEYGWDYVERLVGQRPGTYESTIAMSESIAAGEYAATMNGTDTSFGQLAVSGAPIEFTYPVPTAGTVQMMAMPAEVPHPNAAQLFMEWGSTLEAQTRLSEISQGSVLHEEWEDTRAVAELPWYEAPSEVWMGWQRDERLRGEQLDGFLTRIYQMFGA